MRADWIALAASALLVTAVAVATAGDPTPAPVAPPPAPSAERGYRFLLDKAYVPSPFDQTTVDALWEAWPEPLRSVAEKATPEERRRLTFERYGLTTRPGDASGKPLQFVVDERGAWTVSCFACHGGQVAGRVTPGLPNAHFALQDLVDDASRVDRAKGRPRKFGGAMMAQIPLGETHGTTNAVIFGVALMAFRDRDLNVVFPSKFPTFVHHDLDAPAWWNVKKKKRLYFDGLVAKGHRSLMQFMLVPTNDAARLKSWEADFRDVLAYIESLAPPPWPFDVDRPLAARGKVAFDRTCARCHGTYGPGGSDGASGSNGASGSYPEVMVPLAEIGTDRLRFDALRREERVRFGDSWFTDHDPALVNLDPTGYVAPPLDGIWASAPYLHNGSVPTLWHVLHPDARPAAWCVKSAEGYDRVRVGLDVESRDAPPADLPDAPSDSWTRRSWFDATKRGKSAAGHLFPSTLTEDERAAVLEYLKTL